MPTRSSPNLAVAAGGRRDAVRSITSRFVLLIAAAAVAPLLVYGLVSVRSLRSGTEQSVNAGNLAVARQIAERLAAYFDNNRRVLGSIGGQLQGTQLGTGSRSGSSGTTCSISRSSGRSRVRRAGRRRSPRAGREHPRRLSPPGVPGADDRSTSRRRARRDALPTTTIAVRW